MRPDAVWISRLEADALERKKAMPERHLPLYGMTFAVKDNIDVEGWPTTAGCPAFAYSPARSAMVVRRLEAAGAIAVGKTNLDQFATGLVGTRSPYGAPSSVFGKDYISGGSSSGSAVAVASGQVDFALGTDTAGSGRVPAAFNNLVGVKPSKGLISTQGVFPACRSLDCVSIFAADCDLAALVAGIAAGFDAEDPFSRTGIARSLPAAFRFGVPDAPLDFCGDAESERLYLESQARLESMGGHRVRFDYAPFAAAAALLYQGPYVAERLAALRQAGFSAWEAMDPVVASIIKGAEKWSAADAFQASYRLAELARQTAPVWEKCDLLLLPTAPTIFTHAEIAEDPVGRNAKLGLYTNFVNLLDLCAVAVPAGFRKDGMPFGVSLIAPAFTDAALQGLAGRLHRALAPASIQLAVVGAHLSGQPLNRQLLERRAKLVRTTRTAPGYKLYALAGTAPAKPGLIRDASGAGGIEVEVWELGCAEFGSFTALVPPPLGIGNVTLEDGSTVKGFICEAAGLQDASDITELGGWRAYLASTR